MALQPSQRYRPVRQNDSPRVVDRPVLELPLFPPDDCDSPAQVPAKTDRGIVVIEYGKQQSQTLMVHRRERSMR